MICYLVLKTSCVFKSVEWEMLLWSRERRVMCSECVCVFARGECSVYVTWKLPGWEGRSVQLLALSLAGGNCRWQSNWRWRVVVVVVFVLCTLMKNVFYEAWGSRLFGSRELLHKVILLLSNLMWCTVNLSSQVSFSHLPSFCFGFFVKSAFPMLRMCDRERMLNEVSHSGPCATQIFFEAPEPLWLHWRSSLTLPTLVQKDTHLDNLMQFYALAVLCCYRSKELCPCWCHQHGTLFLSRTTVFYWLVACCVLSYS